MPLAGGGRPLLEGCPSPGNTSVPPCEAGKGCMGGPGRRHSLMRLVELGVLKKSGRYSHLMSAEFMGMARLQRHG